jgi:dynein heavy chain, axonemal
LSPHHGEILVSLARNILQELPEKQPSKGELGEAAHLKHVL